MSRFICWYAYKGMETEGNLSLLEPQIYNAEDVHEATWKYFECMNKQGQLGNLTEIYGDLKGYREKCKEPTGWGLWCEELKN